MMGIYKFVLLTFSPPAQSLVLISTLTLEQILHNELLVFVPPHFQGLLIDIDEVIDLLVVYLQIRYIKLKTQT